MPCSVPWFCLVSGATAGAIIIGAPLASSCLRIGSDQISHHHDVLVDTCEQILERRLPKVVQRRRLPVLLTEQLPLRKVLEPKSGVLCDLQFVTATKALPLPLLVRRLPEKRQTSGRPSRQ